LVRKGIAVAVAVIAWTVLPDMALAAASAQFGVGATVISPCLIHLPSGLSPVYDRKEPAAGNALGAMELHCANGATPMVLLTYQIAQPFAKDMAAKTIDSSFTAALVTISY
jgi:hypothetical protein